MQYPRRITWTFRHASRHCHDWVQLVFFDRCANQPVLTFLTFPAYPVVIQSPESNNWPITKTVTLVCEVAGRPPPTILWYFNSRRIDLIHDTRMKFEVGEMGASFTATRFLLPGSTLGGGGGSFVVGVPFRACFPRCRRCPAFPLDGC